jgi:hypothetical protein|tara:strand:- start:522 stop:656 length:135 start_codon:yes stop_codon:yes gene_type:complete
MKSEIILHLPIKFKDYSNDYVKSYMVIYAMKQGYYQEEIIVGIA